jgi:hypothetical protein
MYITAFAVEREGIVTHIEHKQINWKLKGLGCRGNLAPTTGTPRGAYSHASRCEKNKTNKLRNLSLIVEAPCTVFSPWTKPYVCHLCLDALLTWDRYQPWRE